MNRARLVLLSAAILCAASQAAADDFDYVEYDYEAWYVDAGARLVLPQGGGAKMRRLGGASASIGYYASDALAIEGTAAWLENAVGLGVHGLWHWWLYEPFDPFFTFGANGWIKGEVGPCAGWGCYWHFDDNWSVRFDADATLGVDGRNEMVYQLGVAVQYAF